MREHTSEYIKAVKQALASDKTIIEKLQTIRDIDTNKVDSDQANYIHELVTTYMPSITSGEFKQKQIDIMYKEVSECTADAEHARRFVVPAYIGAFM